MSESPAPDVLADDHDEDGWDIEAHGRMRQFATDDDAVSTMLAPPADEIGQDY